MATSLAKTFTSLSNKTKTDEPLDTLLKKDEESGDTYLKIPVKSQQVVENGLKMFGQFLSGLK